VTEDSFKDTIETCGMKECLLDETLSEAYGVLDHKELVCNQEITQLYDYNKAICCSVDELVDLCMTEVCPLMFYHSYINSDRSIHLMTENISLY